MATNRQIGGQDPGPCRCSAADGQGCPVDLPTSHLGERRLRSCTRQAPHATATVARRATVAVAAVCGASVSGWPGGVDDDVGDRVGLGDGDQVLICPARRPLHEAQPPHAGRRGILGPQRQPVRLNGPVGRPPRRPRRVASLRTGPGQGSQRPPPRLPRHRLGRDVPRRDPGLRRPPVRGGRERRPAHVRRRLPQFRRPRAPRGGLTNLRAATRDDFIRRALKD